MSHENKTKFLQSHLINFDRDVLSEPIDLRNRIDNITRKSPCFWLQLETRACRVVATGRQEPILLFHSKNRKWVAPEKHKQLWLVSVTFEWNVTEKKDTYRPIGKKTGTRVTVEAWFHLHNKDMEKSRRKSGFHQNAASYYFFKEKKRNREKGLNLHAIQREWNPVMVDYQPRSPPQSLDLGLGTTHTRPLWPSNRSVWYLWSTTCRQHTTQIQHRKLRSYPSYVWIKLEKWNCGE